MSNRVRAQSEWVIIGYTHIWGSEIQFYLLQVLNSWSTNLHLLNVFPSYFLEFTATHTQLKFWPVVVRTCLSKEKNTGGSLSTQTDKLTVYALNKPSGFIHSRVPDKVKFSPARIGFTPKQHKSSYKSLTKNPTQTNIHPKTPKYENVVLCRFQHKMFRRLCFQPNVFWL